MTAIRIVYVTTCDASQARELGRSLIEQGLVACANILPAMESIYRWEGEVRQEAEAVLLLKTEERLVAQVIAAVEKLHSYETPCALSLSVEQGSERYLAWLCSELKSGSSRSQAP